MNAHQFGNITLVIENNSIKLIKENTEQKISFDDIELQINDKNDEIRALTYALKNK